MASNSGKSGVCEIESIDFDGQTPTGLPSHPDTHLSEKEQREQERRLIRIIDFQLIPWLCLLYLLSFLDRTNIGNAKIAGLQADLKMTNKQWNAALAIFFVSYSVFEPASNVLLKRLRPSRYIPAIMILCGVACTCQGLVNNFSGLCAARWFLGLFEAGLFPGCQFYLSCWYKRSEFGIRSAVFFSAAAIAGSFGGLLAAAISKIHGVGGRPGWAWIFILEGLLTIVIGFASFRMVHDFPQEATFLSEDDKTRLLYRLRKDLQASAEHESFKWTYVWASLRDPFTYLATLIYVGGGGGLYAFSLFLPTILAELGYSTTTAQLMSVPPYAAAALLTIAIGWIGDKTRRRGYCGVAVASLAIIGFSLLLSDVKTPVKYAATFLAAMGIYPIIPNSVSWLANNTEGMYKRGFTLGFAMCFANIQGVAVSNVYRGMDAPRFILGHSMVMGYVCLGTFAGSALYYILLRRENNLRKAGARNHLIEGKQDSEIRLMGDKK
ncbi:uncharacterized protein A1O9_12590 [Exophiala aquamarina CBS 119918]|uniref:Major facilitator superfamily (MFS) profile domain-containing protein n=1 Tax=Exophiala aquamarina CBS 119918 TaxID=1182545 RepID=A0A072NV01_9EURO|nr:uncharacterized protein A1O9_12590 [Exophiala aquamarina CBS 119918]KEF51441.1 hypothetical protein A1O9_12590 [Exophiala aquamarina CBS 119918]